MSPEQVAEDQRLRIVASTGDVMGERGYLNTSVADIIARAGVSRETFYRLFDNKMDCFLAAFDAIADIVIGHLSSALDDGVDSAVTAYFDVLASDPRSGRLFLVEVHAVGDTAIARRTEVQRDIAEALAEAVGWETPRGRFAAAMVVAAVSAMVTAPLVDGDPEAIRELAPKVMDHIRMLDAGGEL